MEKLQQYGKIGIVTHLALSWSSFTCIYLLMSQTKNPQKILKFLKLQNKIPEKAGTFVISGIIYKASMPVRLAISLMAVPLVIKMFNIQIPETKSQNIQQSEVKVVV